MSDPTKLCDIDAEKALLGSMMMKREVIDDVLPLVSAESFNNGHHSRLFSELVKLHAQDKPMDFVVVMEHLKRHGLVDDAGGPDYMIQLAESFGDWSVATHYAKIVRDKFIRRRLWSIGQELSRKACDELNEPEVDAIVGSAWREAEDVIASGRDIEVEPVDALAARLPEWMRSDRSRVLPTGFDAIDRRIDGFPRPGYAILAARPSVGKTSLGLAFALNIVKRSAVSTLFCSLETPRMRVAGRVFAIDTGKSLQTWRDGEPSNFDFQIGAFKRDFQKAKLHIADTLFGISQITSRARSMIRTHKIGLIVIDYLQLVGGDSRAENRNLEIQGISRTLRMLANKQGVTVLALCQLNRDAVTGKKPGLHNLRESGAIEQDADQVFFIYHGGHAAQVCVDVAKNRDGATGEWTAKFKASTTTFFGFEEGQRLEEAHAEQDEQPTGPIEPQYVPYNDDLPF